MTTVAQVLEAKGPAIWSIAPEAPVYEAIKLMADKKVGALLVVDTGRLVGIVSERDYARKVILQGRSSKDTPVRAIMTGQVISVHPDQTVDACLAVMTDQRIRHLPVLAADHLVGVLSIGDLVKALLADQALLIAQLEQYITGQR